MTSIENCDMKIVYEFTKFYFIALCGSCADTDIGNSIYILTSVDVRKNLRFNMIRTGRIYTDMKGSISL